MRLLVQINAEAKNGFLIKERVILNLIESQSLRIISASHGSS